MCLYTFQRKDVVSPSPVPVCLAVFDRGVALLHPETLVGHNFSILTKFIDIENSQTRMKWILLNINILLLLEDVKTIVYLLF